MIAGRRRTPGPLEEAKKNGKTTMRLPSPVADAEIVSKIAPAKTMIRATNRRVVAVRN